MTKQERLQAFSVAAGKLTLEDLDGLDVIAFCATLLAVREKLKSLDSNEGKSPYLVLTPTGEARPISAIKELRECTGCGLHEGKQAIDDVRRTGLLKLERTFAEKIKDTVYLKVEWR